MCTSSSPVLVGERKGNPLVTKWERFGMSQRSSLLSTENMRQPTAVVRSPFVCNSHSISCFSPYPWRRISISESVSSLWPLDVSPSLCDFRWKSGEEKMKRWPASWRPHFALWCLALAVSTEWSFPAPKLSWGLQRAKSSVWEREVASALRLRQKWLRPSGSSVPEERKNSSCGKHGQSDLFTGDGREEEWRSLLHCNYGLKKTWCIKHDV